MSLERQLLNHGRSAAVLKSWCGRIAELSIVVIALGMLCVLVGILLCFLSRDTERLTLEVLVAYEPVGEVSYGAEKVFRFRRILYMITKGNLKISAVIDEGISSML